MKKILLVEDERMIRAGLKKLIEDVIGGYTVSGEADSGGEALRIFDHVDPDIVITDIRMPGMRGLEMIRQLRALHRDLPVIVISGYAEFEYAREAIRYGVTSYLLKPVDRVELMQALAGIEAPAPDSEGSGDENQLIKKVKQIIRERPGEDLSLKAVSDEVGLNPQYLSALFKKKTGENFSRYITEQRMKYAKKLLKDSNLKIYEIARATGYQSNKHFSNTFHEITGMTPSEYRDEAP